jgi:two-component system, cell cycle response regulator DivK
MKKVLVVEDDADTRLIYVTVLQHRGYAVFGAADGPEGIRMAQEQQPDAIVMNLSMPRLDGVSATAMLKQDSRTARIPVIACTGFIRDEGGDEAEDAGADAYLEKPCTPSRIVQEIERFIGPPGAPQAQVELG